MCTGGRILHDLFIRLPHLNDTVLFVGFQAEGTRGRRILEGEPQIKIFGEMVDVRCRIEYIEGFSAHADGEELVRWLKNFTDKPKYTFFVHGEKEGLEALSSAASRDLGFANTIVPAYLESFELFQSI